jgi:RNA polymerase sigma-70 factor (ECF subfamily)
MSSSSVFGRSLPSGLSVGHARDKDDPSASLELAHPRPDLNDEVLMHYVQQGNREALGLLFDRYASLIRKVGTRILRDNAEAEDLVQEVFLYVHRRSEIFDPSKGQLVSWLVQIAYSRAFNRRERMKASESADYARIEELADTAQDPSFCLLTDDLASRELVEQALAELSEVQRQTLRLYFYQGFSLREIAGELKDSYDNIRHHYYRGIDKLKQIMNRLQDRETES